MSDPIRTTCPYCGVGCGVIARRDDSGLSLSGDVAHPANGGLLCSKGASLRDTLSLDGRLLFPQIHGRRVNWDAAIDTVALGFTRVIKEHGPDAVAFYVSGQLLTEDYYVANKLMKGFIGSGNIDTNSRLCMASAVAGNLRAFGEDIVPGCYEDLEQADLVVMAGANAAWCHPVLFQRLQAARSRRPEQKLVVIDPRRTATAESADLHLALRPGSDVMLFNGLLAFLHAHGCGDLEYIQQQVSGTDAVLARLRERPPASEEVARVCGISAGDLDRFYHWFAANQRVVTFFSQGINQSSAGTDKVNAIINCHLYTGRIGKPGAGPFSITGQPNAMGGREVGGLASTLAAHMDFSPENVERVGRFWNTSNVAVKPGLKAVEMFQAIDKGRIKAVWIMATNPVVSLPDADSVRRALNACELVVVSESTMHTDTTRYATVLLPATAWGEKDGTVTNSERCISRQRSFLPVPEEARPDWWAITRVARRMGFKAAFPYESPHEIFDEHARLSAFENDNRRWFNIGALSGLNRAEYDTLAPVQWPVTASDRRGTPRLFTGATFPTADGRARMLAITYKSPAHPTTFAFPLVLNSGRVRDQWHSMSRTGKSARLCAHTPEFFVAIHPTDAQTLALADGALAEISTRWGRALARVRVDGGQREGEIFAPIHWSDQFANHARLDVLVNPAVDPHSGEPEFKHTPARVRLWPAAWHGFLITSKTYAPSIDSGIDYWARVRVPAGWRTEFAGLDRRDNWASWARRQLGATRPGVDWIEYADLNSGSYRAAHIENGRLVACLFIATAPTGLPSRAWLCALLEQPRLQPADRTGLLAGFSPYTGQIGESVNAESELVE